MNWAWQKIDNLFMLQPFSVFLLHTTHHFFRFLGASTLARVSQPGSWQPGPRQIPRQGIRSIVIRRRVVRGLILQGIATVLLAWSCSSGSLGQTLKPRPPAGTQHYDAPASSQAATATGAEAAPVRVPMSVPAGTPIKVALDSEVRIRSVGQAIQAKTTEPLYAFDKLLIPAGTVVNGEVSAIDSVPGKTRALDAADGNFSPARHVHVQFDELVMGDGRHLALQTVASPAPDGVLRFVSANEKSERKNKVENAASKKVSAARQQIRQQWNYLQKQIHEPGKMH